MFLGSKNSRGGISPITLSARQGIHEHGSTRNLSAKCRQFTAIRACILVLGDWEHISGGYRDGSFLSNLDTMLRIHLSNCDDIAAFCFELVLRGFTEVDRLDARSRNYIGARRGVSNTQ